MRSATKGGKESKKGKKGRDACQTRGEDWH